MENAKMFIERRLFPRYKIQFPVQCCLVGDKNEIDTIKDFSKKDLNAITRDLSLGGMQIELEQPMKVGDVLAFEIPLPGGADSISASAEVIWTDGKINGLHFLIISEEDLTILKAYLKRLGYTS